MGPAKTPEHVRLEQARTGEVPWKAWGPYLSERQWGTVREDYSPGGDAWNHFTHDQARSRAYRWGEDGIAGICDERQRLCLALALWNGNDPILKERMFGLTNSEGNHGEDAKEYWFYLDSTPTHSYLKCQYKYPQRAFPYADLVHENGRRGKQDFEYELLDTGIFAEDRYFDVVVEYAKAAHDDILMRVTAHNRGPEAATLHVLPTLWFRNTWSWGGDAVKPSITGAVARHPELGEWHFETDGERWFCENETGSKSAINDHLIAGAPVGRESGTKCAAHHVLTIEAGGSASIEVRLTKDSAPVDFDAVFAARIEEADAFYAEVIPATLDADRALVMRQALAGLLWGKQYYEYDVHRWLREHGVNPWDPHAPDMRNVPWFHMIAGDIISMPDKWEYPWFAAWDLAFHCAPLSLVDVDFAKDQVELLLKTRYLHPSGQIPAYEWNFGDVNPPVTAWAALWVYQREEEIRGEGDREFLARVFQRLLTNFTWWVNRKDPDGRNLFQGGFLGLDNIGIFDRSAPLPGGGTLRQADGTAWMALYCQWMLQIAVELGRGEASYADIALKFVTHFAWIAVALNPPGVDTPLWDEQDGFFYDVMRMPDGTTIPLRVRSLVGLLPMCAATVFEPEILDGQPGLVEQALKFAGHFGDSVPALAHLPGANAQGRRLLALVDEAQLRQILRVMLDEQEFLGPHGIRAISRYHLDHPYEFDWDGHHYEVRYLPAESDSGMFGGNSNWRGPVWVPMNLVILRALFQLHRYYGEDFKVEYPTGSGQELNLREVALAISHRLSATFLRDEDGRRPVYGGLEPFQSDPHWRDLILFFEYFHGDNGAGLGASHQTGWTGAIASVLRIADTGRRLYELNTAVFLAGRRLEEVDWDFLPDVDAVWLMGVWERSPAGLSIALDDPGLMAGMRSALPDLRDEDVIGSPYCVRDYVVDPRFGDLAAARAALAARGLKLILDYVPNHVAPDHPWLASHPEYFIAGTEDDLARDPASWLRVGSSIFARGRDPYFPAWPDVVQLNAFSAELREAVRSLLERLAGICDGVRCDMAMLMTNEVFSRTWGLEPPAEEFWPTVIRDDLVFIAEAYWDMEYTLQQQGFDYCYDKRLYDRLAHEDAAAVRGHLQADRSYQARLLRFIENHDEPRAAPTFGPRARTAAVVMSTIPGARLYHDGQFDGYRTHIPVFLNRGPVEEPDSRLRVFYSRLVGLQVASDWRLLEVLDHDDLIAWSFAGHLVVVNFGATEAWGRVQVAVDGELTDLLTGALFERSGPELQVGLRPWGAHVFSQSSS